MRLHRVALTDVRGIVGTVEVRFAADGVTVVEAPNETGKSTLLDAVDVALEYKDSSRHRDVKSLWPADRDVPSTIEVELTVGATHLVLTRTYRKQTATRLRILAPNRDTLTGDDAHDRLRQLLETEVDLALAAALRFTQDRGLGPVALGDSTALAARLDAVAGGDGAADDGGLLDRALLVHRRYHTASGKPAKVLTQLDERLEAAERRRDDLAAALQALQQDADQLAEAERTLPAVRARLRDELTPALAAAEARAEEVARATAELTTTRAERDAALADARVAAAELAARDRLRQEHADLAADVATLEADVAPARERLDELTAARTTADDHVADAEHALATARARREAAVAVAELSEAMHAVQQLTDTRDRVRTIQDAARAAERELAAVQVDERTLRAIRTASQDLRVAEAQLRTGAPTVRIRAHQDVHASVDTDDVTVEPGTDRSFSVASHLRIEVPGAVDIEVEPGASSEVLHRAVVDARASLDDACRAVGCSDPDHAEAQAERRRELAAVLERRDAELARELEGGTVADLDDRLRSAEDRLAAARTAAERVLDGAVAFEGATDVGRARAAASDAHEAERTAQTALDQARAARDAVARSEGDQRTRCEVASSSLAERRDRAARVAELLEDARRSATDAELRAAAEAAEERVDACERSVAVAESALEALDPELVTLERDNLRRQLDDARSRIAATEQRIAGLRASLAVRGEDGLGEQLQLAEDALLRVTAEHRRTWARARAAALLVEELTDAREAAVRAYRAPLRERLVRLARLLYGREVDLDLDDDLAIARRTLDGVTLDLEQLSAGAREQLAVLTGLAAAQLAGEDGVPFVLDDALGFSDGARLERLGALLGAATDAQIIVLTCAAERFHHVGGATVVSLRDLLRDEPRVVADTERVPLRPAASEPRARQLDLTGA
jgi:DNA repair exonuclease SbcCD ATPase subunit